MLLWLLPWLLLEQRPADLTSAGDGAMKVEKCRQEGRGCTVCIRTTGHQWSRAVSQSSEKGRLLGCSGSGDTLSRLGTDGQCPRTEWSLLCSAPGSTAG